MNTSTMTSQPGQFLEGQMLIAMPDMADTRFERSLIFLCAHSEDGAMGLIINKPVAEISFRELLAQLEIIPDGEEGEMPAKELTVHRGGPVESGRGFVLHTPDCTIDGATIKVGKGICLTATLDILKVIASGGGPSNALLALGYAGWSPGQLEAEIQSNGWLTSSASPDLLFDGPAEEKYDRALATIGVDPSFLSSEAGHA